MTSYQYQVQCYTPDGRRGTSTLGGGAELAEVLRHAVQQASYYKLACGYPRVTITVSKLCEKCGGAGWTGKRTHKRCPKCDWGTVPLLPEFAFELHPNVELAAA